MMLHPDNPYSLAPVESPRLLRTRRGQIRMALQAVAPVTGAGSHALVCGPRRSGRTSILGEVARRAHDERASLVVKLRLFEEDLTHTGLMRTLLGATIEQLATSHETEPDWYRAWCNRVLLRDRSPMTINDMFMSALAFAADPLATIDPAVLDRDLRTLVRLGGTADRRRILVVVDDADALLEDDLLVERLFSALDATGAFSLLIGARFSGLRHLVDAVSPCLRNSTLVPLPPFWAPGEIAACLTAPLEPVEAERLMPRENQSRLLMDVLQLSNGSPFDIAIAGGQMWEACRTGEQEQYELTPRVLGRLLPMLTMHTGAGDGLHTAAQAVRRLPSDRWECALRLIALSELTVPQIAVARALNLPHTDGTDLARRLSGSDLERERERVLAELEQLVDDGLVTLTDDERFEVCGGRLAALTLKCQARTMLGSRTADQPFEMPFLVTVGQPVARECVAAARSRVEDAGELASQPVHNVGGRATGTLLHAALNLQRFDNVDLDMFATDDSSYERLVGCLAAPDERGIVVVELTLADDGGDLAWVEMWDVPPDTTTHDVNQTLSDVLEEWKPLIEKAGLAWRSSQAVVLNGAVARTSLVQLVPMLAASAVNKLFDGWLSDHDADGLQRALDLADDAVRALQEQRVSDLERGWEFSDMLSRRGFLLSLADNRLTDAAADLERARKRGPADGWVTDWNLANVAVRRGEHEEAQAHLTKASEQAEGEEDAAVAAFHVPGRAARDSVVRITNEALKLLLPLQRAIIGRLAGGPEERLISALAACEVSEEESVQTIVGWVTEALERGALVSQPRTPS
jgi:hypothetical protein